MKFPHVQSNKLSSYSSVVDYNVNMSECKLEELCERDKR